MSDGKIEALFHALEVSLTAKDKEKLAQISQAYFNVVNQNFELIEENHHLRTQLRDKEVQIKELNMALKERQKLEMEINKGIPEFFIKGKDGVKIGPVCQSCYNKDGSVVVLQTSSNNCAFCPRCKG